VGSDVSTGRPSVTYTWAASMGAKDPQLPSTFMAPARGF
jgi:hypothetical protein